MQVLLAKLENVAQGHQEWERIQGINEQASEWRHWVELTLASSSWAP